MIKIFDTLLDDGTWAKRAFNCDYIIAARPVNKDSIIISNLFGEFEVKGSLEDLVEINKKEA